MYTCVSYWSYQFHNNNEYAVKARVNLWPVQPMALDTIKADVWHLSVMQDIFILVIILKFKYLRKK